MEIRLYRQLRAFILQVAHPRQKRLQFSDHLIVLVLLWAYLHDRAVCWACDADNWPKELDHPLPSSACMSRRLRRVGVSQLLERVMRKLADLSPQTVFKSIDSMPLRVGNYSQDRDAKRGRAAGGMARGYKLHLISSAGIALHWTLSGMHSNDQTAAHELLPRLSGEGYLVADNAYDANPVHGSAQAASHQLIAPPRKANQGVRDVRRNLPARLRALDVCDSPLIHAGLRSDFGNGLMTGRKSIERDFSRLHFNGMYAPPPHVRHPRRVALWAAIKLLIVLFKQAKKAGVIA
jgi:hypothetical protein